MQKTFQKMLWNYNIVLETDHFLSFFPNLNEKGHVLFLLYILYHAAKSLARLCFSFLNLFKRCF